MSRPLQVDPRGLRFSAALTSVLLAVALVVPTGAMATLLLVQAAVFAVGAAGHLTRSPYAVLFARVVRPRIGAPDELEDARPPRFAQVVGLVFVTLALVALALGATVAAQVAVGLALVAALLNATVGLCLGCEMYLVLRRLGVTAGTPA